VATEIAELLMGKHKPMFSRNADTGDSVVVINAEKVQVTGKKAESKIYYWHSNYPGGFKQINYSSLMRSHPERIIRFAVDGMLPHNHLHDRMLKRLKVFAGPEAVKPKPKAPVAMETKANKALIRNIPAEVKKTQKKEAKR
jgi:large subunit ribosomal protein L13